MLDWIDVDVIDVIVEIFLVHDRVFPEPALPNAAFALGGTGTGLTFFVRDSARESGLDARPAIGVVVVALRITERGTQIIDALLQQPATATLHQVDGKEAGTTLDPDSAIVGHAMRIVAP